MRVVRFDLDDLESRSEVAAQPFDPELVRDVAALREQMVAAPDEMPTSSPSSRAIRRAVWKASSFLTRMISS